MSIYLLVMSVGLYGVFLAIQTMRHRSFFQQPVRDAMIEGDGHHDGLIIRSLRFHALVLPVTMLPIVLLSKKMAILVDHGTDVLGAPHALSGFLVAILVLSPEGVAAVRAALDNKLQRTMNNEQ